MSNILNAHVSAIRDAIAALDSNFYSLSGLKGLGSLAGLLAFSPVSGLDMAGRTHGTITTDYQPVSTKALASHIRDTAVLLESNLDNTIRADLDLSGLFSQIGKLGMEAYTTQMSKPVAPPTLINATTGRFANAAAVAGPQVSLAALNQMMMATRVSEAANASAQWAKTATQLAEVVTSLNAAKADLAISAETSWVSNAIERINRIQWAGATYAKNATALATHTANLATVAQANQVATAATHAVWLGIPEPAAKLAFEQAYVVPFPATLTASLAPTTPLFNQLLPALSDMPGTTFEPDKVEAPATPGFDETPLPKVVAEALAQRGFTDLARATTPAEVVSYAGEINPDTLAAMAAGATPTEVAAVAAPHMPATLTPGAGIGATGASGFGGPSVTGAAGPLGAMGMPAGFTAAPNPHSGSVGASRAGGGLAPGGPGAYRAGATPGAGTGRGAGGLAPHTTSGLRGGAGLAGGLRGGASAGAGSLVGGVPLSGATPGTSAAPGTGAGPTGGATPATVAGGGTTGRTTPIAAGPMHGAGHNANNNARNNRRMKAVTSAVEREGNLRALLGTAPATLPSVIGYNVTQK